MQGGVGVREGAPVVGGQRGHSGLLQLPEPGDVVVGPVLRRPVGGVRLEDRADPEQLVDWFAGTNNGNIFVPNADEAELILGETDPVRQARIFHDLGARRVVVTCGEWGVVSISDSLQVKLAAYSVPYVDGSGGGDAFNAGYIVGLLEDRPEIECLKLASAVGASCVRAVGTTAGVFTRAEAEEFVGRHELAIEPIR